jgi:hypothetical protein
MKNLRRLIPDEIRLSTYYSRYLDYQARWQWISRILVVGALIFIAVLLVQSWPQIRTISWKVFIPIILISLGIYLVSLLLQMGVWLNMLSFEHGVGWRDIQIYTQTVVMRRIPGGVWHWIGRSASYKANSDVGLRRVLLANFLEWMLIIVAAGVVYAIFATEVGPVIRIVLLSISIVLGIALASTWLPRDYGSVRRVAHSLSWLLVFGGSWILGGVILYLFMAAGDYSELDPVQATAIWCLAGGISALTIVAPSGFGIRELSLGILLTPYAPLSYIILVALLIRLTFTLADLLWGSVGWLISTRFRGK